MSKLPPEYDHLKVVFPDGEFAYINPALVARQKLPSTHIVLLHDLWLQRWHIYAKAKALFATLKPDLSNIDAVNLKYQPLVAELEQVEFNLQSAWMFSKDRKYHEAYKIPGCSCRSGPWKGSLVCVAHKHLPGGVSYSG